MENKLVTHNKMVQKNENERQELLEKRRHLERMIKKALIGKARELDAEWSEVEVHNRGNTEIKFYKKDIRRECSYSTMHLTSEYEYDKEVASLKFNHDLTKIKPCNIELDLINEIIEVVKEVVYGDR